LHFENLFISKEVLNDPLVAEIKNKITFNNLVEVEGENHPGNGLLLTNNKGAYIKPCPGQKGSVCCGYWVVEWGMGCPFQCEYCILQNYAIAGDITLFLNWDKCHQELIEWRKKYSGKLRLGTGQFGDPLGLEEIFPLNAKMIEWTADMEDVCLEIKSKSDYINPVLEAKDAKHVTLAFSLNPQSIVDRFEHGASSLVDRLEAAQKAAATKGCSLAFHFDPLIPVKNWKEEYTEVFKLMAKYVSNYDVKWISVGTFRFPKGFQDYVEKYHPGTGIFIEEFYHSFDGKIRYFRPFREEIYTFAREGLQPLFPNTEVYMCMESQDVWERVAGQQVDSSVLKVFLDKQV
jgi:spore photoproduct lyase